METTSAAIKKNSKRRTKSNVKLIAPEVPYCPVCSSSGDQNNNGGTSSTSLRHSSLCKNSPNYNQTLLEHTLYGINIINCKSCYKHYTCLYRTMPHSIGCKRRKKVGNNDHAKKTNKKSKNIVDATITTATSISTTDKDNKNIASDALIGLLSLSKSSENDNDDNYNDDVHKNTAKSQKQNGSNNNNFNRKEDNEVESISSRCSGQPIVIDANNNKITKVITPSNLEQEQGNKEIDDNNNECESKKENHINDNKNYEDSMQDKNIDSTYFTDNDDDKRVQHANATATITIDSIANVDKNRNAENKTKNNKPKWQTSSNPWGTSSHNDHDILLITPSPHHTSTSTSNKRFIMYPLNSSSSYVKNHDYEYKFVQLKRDRLNQRPWGIYFEYDDFGGACFITSISPCSPAEAAIDAGSGQNNNNDYPYYETHDKNSSSFSSIIQVGDIILSINGKIVGGMTENELYYYFNNTCGSEVTIVFGRKVGKNKNRHQESLLNSVHNNNNSVSMSYSLSSNCVNDVIVDNDDSNQKRKKSTNWNPKSVCGKTHKKSPANKSNIFWMQCCICDTWHKVSKDCVGMTLKEVSAMNSSSNNTWECNGCLDLSISSSSSSICSLSSSSSYSTIKYSCLDSSSSDL